MSRGILSWGNFVLGGILSREILSGGFCPGGFCPGGFCPDTGEIMRECISLRPKIYSYKVGKSEPKKCKGIKKCVVKKTITFDDYKRCLFEGRDIYKSQLLFRSDKHEIKTLEVNKLALSSKDDKRISIDGIASYAMGHYKTT